MNGNGNRKVRFTQIRVRNDLNTAETVDGERVERQESIFIPEVGAFVKCAPMDNHFIFETKKKNRWSFMCTCGGPAVIVGSKAYSHLGSPEGQMLVCYIHTLSNKHLDGSS